MRGRLSLALTAATMLFLLEGLNVMLATLFATLSEAIYPRVEPYALLPALIPVAALCAPMLPVARFAERRGAIAAAAVAAAAARVPMCLPQHSVRLLAAALVVAAAAIFLSSAVGFLERRSLAGGLGAAMVIDQLARFAGWSWDVTLRSWWIMPQLATSTLVALIAAAWFRMPPPADDDAEQSLERRAGGLRLRGALVLGLLLFLDLNIVGRAEVATRLLGVRYEAAAVLLIAAGTGATLLMLAGHGPIGRGRRAALFFAAVITAAALLVSAVPHAPLVLLLAAAHAMALLLIGRALVPAGGRREGRTLSGGLLLWLLLNTLYTFTFFPSFTFPGMRDAAPLIIAVAGALLFAIVALLPRGVRTPAPLHGRTRVTLALLSAIAAAGLLAIRSRTPPPDEAAGAVLRVATFNVHHGFDDRWQYDPARISAAIAAARADVIALQELGAALPVAYGTDLPLYLSRRLGLRMFFAPTHNGLMGDALLTRLRGREAALLLESSSGDRRTGIVFDVPAAADTVRVLATRLGVTEPDQRAQLTRLLEAAANRRRVVLVGDLNATADDDALARVHAAGFEDAFLLAGVEPHATAPAREPQRRIDWILVRGVAVDSAAVAAAGGSDHRMVTGVLRLR